MLFRSGAISNGAYVIGPLLGGTLFDISGSGDSSLSIAAVVSFVMVVATAVGLPSGRVGNNGKIEKVDENL